MQHKERLIRVLPLLWVSSVYPRASINYEPVLGIERHTSVPVVAHGWRAPDDAETLSEAEASYPHTCSRHRSCLQTSKWMWSRTTEMGSASAGAFGDSVAL